MGLFIKQKTIEEPRLYTHKLKCGVTIKILIGRDTNWTKFQWTHEPPYNAVEMKEINKVGWPWIIKIINQVKRV